MLTNEQIEENIDPQQVFRSNQWHGYNWIMLRNSLRQYATLDSVQRKAFFSNDGLRMAFLRPEQYQAVCEMLYPTSKKFEFDVEKDNPVLTSWYTKKENGQVQWHVKCCLENKKVIKDYFYDLPKYEEPKKEPVKP